MSEDEKILILHDLSYGKTTKEIGKEHGKSPRTIEDAIAQMMKVYDCKNSVSLVAKALRNNIIF